MAGNGRKGSSLVALRPRATCKQAPACQSSCVLGSGGEIGDQGCNAFAMYSRISAGAGAERLRQFNDIISGAMTHLD